MIQFIIAASEEVAPNPILPEPVELIVGAIVFFVVFGVIARFAFPPLNAMLAGRTDKIQGELERAEQVRREAQSELAAYQKQLAGAREEANRIIEDARKAGDQLRREIQERATREAADTVARAQDEIHAERDRAFQELRGQVGDLAVEIAGRVVGESLDKRRHAKLIDEFIDGVAKAKR